MRSHNRFGFYAHTVLHATFSALIIRVGVNLAFTVVCLYRSQVTWRHATSPRRSYSLLLAIQMLMWGAGSRLNYIRVPWQARRLCVLRRWLRTVCTYCMKIMRAIRTTPQQLYCPDTDEDVIKIANRLANGRIRSYHFSGHDSGPVPFTSHLVTPNTSLICVCFSFILSRSLNCCFPIGIPNKIMQLFLVSPILPGLCCPGNRMSCYVAS